MGDDVGKSWGVFWWCRKKMIWVEQARLRHISDACLFSHSHGGIVRPVDGLLSELDSEVSRG